MRDTKKNCCQKWDLNPRPHTRTRILYTTPYHGSKAVYLESGALDHSAILTELKNVGKIYQSVLFKKKKDPKKVSRAQFRSTDLWVMGPARIHCATLLSYFKIVITNDHISNHPLIIFYRLVQNKVDQHIVTSLTVTQICETCLANVMFKNIEPPKYHYGKKTLTYDIEMIASKFFISFKEVLVTRQIFVLKLLICGG